MTVVPAERCLALYSQDDWKALCGRLETVERTPQRRRFERFLSEHTVEAVSCDSQGRLLVLPSQREFAQIGREVVTIRTESRVEIWAKDRYEAQRMSDDEAAAYSDEAGFF